MAACCLTLRVRALAIGTRMYVSRLFVSTNTAYLGRVFSLSQDPRADDTEYVAWLMRFGKLEQACAHFRFPLLDRVV